VREVAPARSEPGDERRADRAADAVEDDVERCVELSPLRSCVSMKVVATTSTATTT